MALYGKLETDVEMKASAEKFHEIIHKTPHHLSNICPDKVKSCELYEGEWGKVGSILHWHYFFEGKPCVSKRVIEAVDEENNSLTWKEIEGDILKHFKSLRFIIQCTPKDKGSVAHITLDYEKLHEGIPDAHSFLQLCADTAKDIDAYLMGYNNGSRISAKA